MRNLKPELWGSPLVQGGKYQEKPVKREEEIIIIITIVYSVLYIMVNIKNKVPL
jgi:hypothetical protein